ncbi:MAG TPA: nicotinate-nucleotide adenylyltransferase [Myxococcota bacterium]|nr:nicotinate-nucleotide adenylyltransferase [Myxococcota bacterium]
MNASSRPASARATTDHGPRTGVFGGTFNPIHLGHLRAAEEVRQALSLDRVLFVPSRIPPHKHTDPDDPIADSARRLRWVERAIAGHPDFSVDRVEIEREGPSFLVDTLATIRGRDGTGTAPPPVFIVGQDAFAEMGDWRAPERIFALADLAVMTRPPGHLRHLADRLPAIVRDDYDIAADGRAALHRSAGTRIDLVPITPLDISSSRVREECRAGRSIRYLVPESVREEIEESRCYAARPAARAHG